MFKQLIDFAKINWHSLSDNLAAILEKNPEKIDWHSSSENPTTIFFLEKNLEKIDWIHLSEPNLQTTNSIRPPISKKKSIILPAAEDEKSVNIPDAELCIICKDRKSCTVIIDCGHANLCITCVRHLVLDEEITTCPTCRAKMTNIIKIFR
jgi:hypothetical protein